MIGHFWGQCPCGIFHKHGSRGKQSYNKGKPMSEEQKRKISESNKGKVLSYETRLKIKQAMAKQVFTEEHRKHMSESMKKKWAENPQMKENLRNYLKEHHWNRGKHLSDEHKRKVSLGGIGKHIISTEHRKLLSDRWKDKSKNPVYIPELKKKIIEANKCRKLTDKQRIEMSKRMQGMFKGNKNPFYGKTHDDKTREIIREKRLKQIIPYKDTRPERMVQIALSLESIKFEKHKAITGQPDIFIEPNLCIFIDGCYWHGCTECKPYENLSEKQKNRIVSDMKTNHKLTSMGYFVLRIPEHEIVKNNANSINKIMNIIKTIVRIPVEINS